MYIVIVFDNVTLRYHYDEYDLLKGVSFRLVDGVNTILVDTQSGKTSICRLLINDVTPTSGQILVDSSDISSITNANLDILYLPSSPVFFNRRSVLYNIEYPLRVRKVSKEERRKLALDVAQKLNLDGLDRKVNKLSQAERRAVALARGLTVKRDVVLCDDFFQATEQEQVKQTIELFDAKTFVILTSDPQLAVGNVVVIDFGKVVYEGSAEQARQIVNDLGWLASQDLDKYKI